ncbi:hypothetical protein EDB83DRAFT_2320440 [Lactarius deliciosus]|nr:hypothetical protein EDB83DRAFT_2320440 [Lactarius deliciosus]
MNPFRSSPKCHARTAARRLFSARGIITKVNGIIRRLFSKAKQEPPVEDVFEGREKELENSSSIMYEEPNIQQDQSNFKLQVLYEEEDLQMATLVHISRQLSASLASPERLDVVASSDLFAWRDPGEADAVQWLEFLRLFPGVKRLEVSSTLASIVASAFEQVTRTSDVLPSLSELHIGGSQASTSSSIEGFAAVRERSGHPVSVHYQSEDNRDLTYEVARVDSDHVPIIPPRYQLPVVGAHDFCKSSRRSINASWGCHVTVRQERARADEWPFQLTDELPQRSFSISFEFYRTCSVNRSSKSEGRKYYPDSLRETRGSTGSRQE